MLKCVNAVLILSTFAIVAGCSADSATASSDSAQKGTRTAGALDISGTVVFHSMNKLASGKTGKPIDATQLGASVVDVDTFPKGAPLAEAPLTGDACVKGTAGECKYSFPATAATGLKGDLGLAIVDGRPQDPLWIPSVTGAATRQQVSELVSAGEPLDWVNPFAVTRDALDAVVADVTKISSGELLNRGMIFGLVYSTTSTAGRGEPVQGATVSSIDPDVTIFYFNNNFSGTGTSTAAQGAFLAVPKAAGAASKTAFSVTPPPGMTHTWDATRQAYFLPGAIYFHVMYASD